MFVMGLSIYSLNPACLKIMTHNHLGSKQDQIPPVPDSFFLQYQMVWVTEDFLISLGN